MLSSPEPQAAVLMSPVSLPLGPLTRRHSGAQLTHSFFGEDPTPPAEKRRSDLQRARVARVALTLP